MQIQLAQLSKTKAYFTSALVKIVVFGKIMKTGSVSPGFDEVRCQLWEVLCLGYGTDDVTQPYTNYTYISQGDNLWYSAMWS